MKAGDGACYSFRPPTVGPAGLLLINQLSGDVLEVSGSLGIESGFISTDQEKASDRVEHQYLWRPLKAVGFSPGSIAMVQVVSSEIESPEDPWGLSPPLRSGGE